MIEIIELISTYGTPLIITGVVVYGVWRCLDIFIKYLEQKMLPEALSKEKDRATQDQREEHSEKLVLRRIIDGQIRVSLNRLLLKTDAARLFVFEFHNGGENLQGLPFLRATNTYEVVNTGVPTRITQGGAVPASIISATTGDLISKGGVTLKFLDQCEEISEIGYEYMNKWGVAISSLARISSVSGELIGFIGIDFNQNHLPKDLEDIEEKIKEAAVELGGLLSLNPEAEKGVNK